MTAKHCCKAGFCREGDSVTLGDHDTDDFDVGEISIEIEEVKILPGCPDCDLALVILKEEAPSNRYIQAANLPDLDEQCPPGKEVIVCGWGADFYNHTRNEDKLWCVEQECAVMGECPAYHPLPKEYALCTTNRDDRRNSPCHGDSGGPLTYTDENGKTTLLGVVQGPGRDEDEFDCKYSEVFSRVSHPNVLKWIKETIDLYA